MAVRSKHDYGSPFESVSELTCWEPLAQTRRHRPAAGTENATGVYRAIQTTVSWPASIGNLAEPHSSTGSTPKSLQVSGTLGKTNGLRQGTKKEPQPQPQPNGYTAATSQTTGSAAAHRIHRGPAPSARQGASKMLQRSCAGALPPARLNPRRQGPAGSCRR